MATYTEKLGLKMPAQTDFYNVDDFNENFRKIDENTAQGEDIQQVLTLADPIRSNRAPTTADKQYAGKLWVVPKIIFNNMMPNALTQVAGNWHATAATVSVSGNAATLVGNGAASTIAGEVNMTAVKTNDIVYIAAKMTVTADANGAVLELLCGDEVIATTSMNVPVAGNNIRLIGHTKVGAAGALKLRTTAMYNSASAQLGKGVTISDITILDLTADMCQNFAGIEFSKDAATTYIDTYGNFQTKTYELSECWWICRGSYGGQYSWQRYDDYTNAVMNEYSTNYQNSKATTAEAQAGTNANHWMSPATTKAAITAITPMLDAILSSETKAMYDLPNTADPDELFAKLRIPLGTYGFKITVKLANGSAVSGFEITENPLYPVSTRTLKTNSNGVVYCYANSKSVSATFGETYFGVIKQTKTLTADATKAFTPVTITLANDTTLTSLKLLETSADYKLAGNIASADFCAVGGGGGGRANQSNYDGRGGGGGYVTNDMNRSLSGKKALSIEVGAGGSRNSTGGTTTVKLDGTTIASAAGGQNGTGNGNGGGSGKAGGNGTVRVFNDSSLPLPGGGGGCGNAAGGKDFGGHGAWYGGGGSGVAGGGTSGTGPGGGGGGMNYGTAVSGGDQSKPGHNGGVYVRVRYIS